MLEVRDLAVQYGRVTALRSVSLNVDEGEIVSIVGPNGAGKSTLLGAIAGVVGVTSGTISLDGSTLVGARPEDIARRGIGLVPEGRHIFAKLTVLENLRLGGSTIERSAIANRIDDVLDRFPDLKRYAKSNAGRLSGGEQQQLAIARALVARPRLMLLDEPSLGLAPLIVRNVLATLGELREAGITIVLVEQFATQARAVADRTYVLSLGSLVLEIGQEDDVSSEQFESAYFGERSAS
jgi:branched-chain amino acid transport system ATP-binding protein